MQHDRIKSPRPKRWIGKGGFQKTFFLFFSFFRKVGLEKSVLGDGDWAGGASLPKIRVGVRVAAGGDQQLVLRDRSTLEVL